jgi:hypothetical protein
LVYLISFDNETSLFFARLPAQPLIRGEGRTLYAAVENLEKSLIVRENQDHLDRFNVQIQVEEKEENELALTAKLSVLV